MQLNPNPVVYDIAKNKAKRRRFESVQSSSEDAIDPVDAEEIFELIRHVNDPEHPLTLEQLKVLCPEHIFVDEKKHIVKVEFTPTIPHCSMATLIGLCIRVKLQRSIPHQYKIDVKIHPGTHSSEVEVNRQLNDKERVAAAMENSGLVDVVTKCVLGSDPTADVTDTPVYDESPLDV